MQKKIDLNYFLKPKSYFISHFLKKIPFIGQFFAKNAWHYPDWIDTPHNKSFVLDSDYQNAYARAVQAGGFDYNIPWRVHQAIWAASVGLHLSGDFVEVGTGNGFIMTAVLESIRNWSALSKQCFLYDVFNKPEKSGFGKIEYSKYYASDIDSVKSNFSEYKRVNVVQGDVRETLLQTCPEQISFLHIDLNNADSEVYCLLFLWEKMSQGAVILLDDYANLGLEDQYEAINNVFKSLNRTVLTTPSGQGIVIK